MSERVVGCSFPFGNDKDASSLLRSMWLVARKTLAAFEVVLATLLCTLSMLAPALLALGDSGESPILNALFVPLGLACPFLCGSCLVLLVKFLSDGGQALLEDSFGWWCGVAVGVVLVFAGFASVAAVDSGVGTAGVLQRFALFTAGAPLLIPAAHMLIEALVARRTRDEA